MHKENHIPKGHTTDVVWENTALRGQIQIVKVAAEDNNITKQKKGDKLEGAVFEVCNDKLELVDIITTDKKGIAITKLLPLGKYTIEEVKSPDYWLINGTVFEAEIKVHGDISRFVVKNSPVKIGTTVEKRVVVQCLLSGGITSNVEAVARTSIRYDFKNICNTSNVPLEQFYWHDILPTDAVRLETTYTGIWNEKLIYSVTYKTNLKNEYTVLAEGLTTDINNKLDCSPNALGLAANKYVTDYKFEFGTVKPGFKEVGAPFIFVRVLPTLPNEYVFTNRTDTGGRYLEKWTYDKDAWVTIVYKKPEGKGKLPKTGL